MSGSTPRGRHGLAGLLVALFVVGGLIFSYGLGHGAPARVCTQHAVSVPVGAVSAGGDHAQQGEGAGPPSGFHGLAGAVLTSPDKPPAPVPTDACLCLAVLLSLLLLGLAGGFRRPLSRLPARAGWALAPPPGAPAAATCAPALQVLRL
ncbi:hypothetical protein [Actinomadura madurae]|uniref:hypothetical protein n=1 Tax=Actinomadura madurae TaxID=1993 RepID=UPI0020270369|nr:hypothetical protein [Actinomadura madurae]MCQ0021419.1 hypothetical protein [Actinomadura madurae]URN03565.1 hypothetical protein LUW74_09575 [Actinomadura madurae]